MADLPISGLPAATALVGTEVLPLVQGGVTKKATANSVVALVIDAAPAALDTLNELAAALADDANFAATVTTALAGKAGLAGAAHTGTDSWTLATAATDALTARITGDAVPRWTINADGSQEWSDGTNPADVNLSRDAADRLRTLDDLRVRRISAGVVNSAYMCGMAGTHPGTGTTTIGFGCEFTGAATSTVAIYGATINVRTTATVFTVATVAGVLVQAPVIGATSTATSVYGVKIDAQVGGTNNYGVTIGASATQTLWISDDIDNTVAASGIAFGLSRDAVAFRKAANVLGVNTGGAAKTVSASLGGTIFNHFTDAGNGTTVETDLYSNSVAASTLSANGHKLSASYDGIFAATAATKRLQVYFGGTQVFDSGAMAVAATLQSWVIKVRCIRVSSSVVRCAVDFNGVLAIAPAYVEVTGLTLTNAQILKITGTAGVGGVNNDIVAKQGVVEFNPAA